MGCTEARLWTKREISVPLSSRASLDMEQKTKVTEEDFRFQPNVLCATLSISETFS